MSLVRIFALAVGLREEGENVREANGWSEVVRGILGLGSIWMSRERYTIFGVVSPCRRPACSAVCGNSLLSTRLTTSK